MLKLGDWSHGTHEWVVVEELHSAGDILWSHNKPRGVLLQNVVHIDFTKQVNYVDACVGGTVDLLKRGVILTDNLVKGCKPQMGEIAYCTKGGKITNRRGIKSKKYRIGYFLTDIYNDGFVKVDINIPYAGF